MILKYLYHLEHCFSIFGQNKNVLNLCTHSLARSLNLCTYSLIRNLYSKVKNKSIFFCAANTICINKLPYRLGK